jgi:hypothetical protein
MKKVPATSRATAVRRSRVISSSPRQPQERRSIAAGSRRRGQFDPIALPATGARWRAGSLATDTQPGRARPPRTWRHNFVKKTHVMSPLTRLRLGERSGKRGGVPERWPQHTTRPAFAAGSALVDVNAYGSIRYNHRRGQRHCSRPAVASQKTFS